MARLFHDRRNIAVCIGLITSIFTFESINKGSIARLSDVVEGAINRHEPRIDLEKVDIDHSNALDGKLLIQLTYMIKSVNVRTNAVFPFYIKEGTHITDM